MAKKVFARVSGALRWPKRIQFLRGYFVVAGAIIVHLTLGSLYTFGNLLPYLVSYIRQHSHPRSLTSATGAWLFALVLVGQGSSMFVGGWLEKKIGPRLSTLTGGGLMSLGVLLSFVAIKVSFWLLLLTYGLVFGVGMGIAYVGPLTSAMRWMPRWKGVAAGFVLAGFGLGALIFDPLQTIYINPHNISADEDGYFVDEDLLDRIPNIFLIMGAIYVVMQVVGSLLIVNPPEEEDVEEEEEEIRGRGRRERHLENRDQNIVNKSTLSDLPSNGNLITNNVGKPQADTPEAKNKGQNGAVQLERANSTTTEAEDSFSSHDEASQLLSRQLNNQGATVSENGRNKAPAAKMKRLKASEFESSTTSTSSLLSTSSRNVIVSLHPLQMLQKLNFYLLWCMMLLSGFAVFFTASLYKVFGQSFIKDDHFLAIVGSMASICNCAGRIVWGLVADVVSYKFALVLQSGVMSAFLLTFYATSATGEPMYFIWVCVIFFCLGGVYSLYPTAIARSFGPKYMGMNYGLLFTSQIISAILAVVLLSTLQIFLEWYGLIFLISGLSLFGFLLILVFRPKRYVSLDL